MHGTWRRGPRNGCLGTTARQSGESEYDHHAALDSCRCGTIHLAHRDSTGTWSSSVGNLHASATLWVGRGGPGILESAWPDRGHPRGRSSNMDSCFRYFPDSLYGQARPDSLLLDDAWPVQIDTSIRCTSLNWGYGLAGPFFSEARRLIGFLVLWPVVSLIILPREERSLESAFGQTYLQCKSRVPRWFSNTNNTNN